MIPAEIRSAIVACYAVVFGNMTWLIKIVILLLLATMTVQLFLREVPRVLSWTILIVHAPLIFQGVFRIIPMVDVLILNTQTPEFHPIAGDTHSSQRPRNLCLQRGGNDRPADRRDHSVAKGRQSEG